MTNHYFYISLAYAVFFAAILLASAKELYIKNCLKDSNKTFSINKRRKEKPKVAK